MRTYRDIRRVSAACLLLIFLLGIVSAIAMTAIWPKAGDERKTRGELTVDMSHTRDGYILAKAEPTSSKLKLRISKDDFIYTYDLNGDGNYEIFPLQMGSGSYTCVLYKNVKSNKYTKEAEITVKAELENEYAAFLVPNQYVNYTQDSPAVQKSMELCRGLTTDAEKFAAIRDFLVGGFVYDYVLALTISQSYISDIDACFESRMGLCQDFSALAACMLRVQGIPTQLVIGYAGNAYHAWNHVLIDGEYRRLDITAAVSGVIKDKDYTVERCY